MAFEQAAQSIVDGDLSELRKLLDADPSLIHTRSTRDHHSTLLHYVAANGIEDALQRTPPNILEITRFLLDSGADPNAESDAYGGRSTALNLTATSVHPEKAGLQIPLLQLLLDRGAIIQPGDLNACLANGRGAAAAFLANRGAYIDLEGAAGTGRLNLARELFPSSTPEQRKNAIAWSSEYGHLAIVEFLLDHAVPFHTSLHWAA